MADTQNSPVEPPRCDIGNAIEMKFHELFDEFVLQLSETHFQSLFDTMKSGDSTLVGNPIVVNFKSKLLALIKHDFIEFWRDFQVDESLALLRDTQSVTKPDAPKEGWRPTAKTPLEQTRYFRVFILRKKIAFLQKQVPVQKQSINNHIIRLEKQRDLLKSIETRRQSLTTRIHQRLKEIELADL